jgi:HEAT repeat protein
MNIRRFVLALVLAGAACAQEKSDLRREVTAILDDWTTRADANAAIGKLGPDAVVSLSTIATDDSETHPRRWRAISLLGNLPPSESLPPLDNIATSAKPVYRCFALQALAETGSEDAIRVAVTQLDNNSPCMTANSTDPARETTIRVSDEAVRALEAITGKSFEANSPFGVHRAAEPWKKWWDEQRQNQKEKEKSP